MDSGKSGNKKVYSGEERPPFKQRGAVRGEELERYSVYVDNVDYWCTAQDLKTHFECCGNVNRITIPTNEFGTPQGHAYVEFSDVDSVDKALLQLNGSVLRSREITVSRKKKQRSNWNPNNNKRRGFQQQQELNSRISRPPNANTNTMARRQPQPLNNNKHQRPPTSSRFSYHNINK